ncbi:MAG: TIGR02099 family protein [Polynucleobacter sp.]|nr:TIGR02099 family protein [Polynucleobacter sp.]
MFRNVSLGPLLRAMKSGIAQLHWSRWLIRLLKVMAVLAALAVALHFGVRYLVWPQIEKSKPTLEKLIGSRLGVTVTMDDVRVTWDGLRPEFEIDGLRFYSQTAAKVNESTKNLPALTIQSISGELSLLSFYHLAPYFEKLAINNAELTAERNQAGIVSIAGIALDPNESSYAGSNWLLAQNTIQLSNAVIHWRDQEKKKLDTDVRIESLAISSGLRDHLIDLVAYLPSDPSPVRLSADFQHSIGGEPGNWRNWSGQFTWDFKGLNLNRLALDFKLPLPMLEGVLESRGFVSLNKGRLSGGDALLFADDLRVQFKQERDLLEFGRLEAEIQESSKGKVFAVTSKKLAWRDFASPKNSPLKELSPMSFYWTPAKAGEEIREFGFASPRISVDDATLFALNLPLPNKLHRIIADSKASGLLENVDIQWSEKSSALPLPKTWLPNANLALSIKADLSNFRFLGPRNVLPSVTNLSGRLETNEKQGSLILNSPNLELDISGFLADPKLKLETAKGRIDWKKVKGQWQISGKDVAFSNPDVSASLTANYLFGDPKQTDSLTLNMQFDRATLTQVHRYLPVEMDRDARTYLSKAFAGGEVQQGRLFIKGDPDQIPYSAKNPGEFTLNLPIKNTTYSPVPILPAAQGTWPAFTNISGTVTMKEAALKVQVDKANYQNVLLQSIQATINDINAPNSEIRVKGSASGDLKELLNYIKPTPIMLKRPSVAQLLNVSGPADLSVDLAIPLSGPKDPDLDIRLTLLGNQIQWSDFPPLLNAKGNLRIQDDFPMPEMIRADVLGGSLQVTSQSSSGPEKLLTIAGGINTNELKKHLADKSDSTFAPVLNAMTGRINYDGQVRIDKSNIDSNIRFNLNAFGLNVPEPLNKVINTPLTARLNLKSNPDPKSGGSATSWSGQIGERIFMQGSSATGSPLRQAYGIGMPANLPQNGIAFGINANELDLDAWYAFLKPSPAMDAATKKGGEPLPSKHADADVPVEITAQVKKLTLLNRHWSDLQLTANQKGPQLKLQISSPQVAGQIQWQGKKKMDIAGQLSGKLSALRIPETIASADTTNLITKQQEPVQVSVRELPSINVAVDDFRYGDKSFGKVSLKATRLPTALIINNLQVSNPQDTTVISGAWRGSDDSQKERTEIDVTMAIADLGPIAARWGNPKSIEGGEGKISGKLVWNGSVFEPQLTTLSGKINVALEKGRLLKVDTTAAKLFSVLSLQSLLRFATLDLQGSLGTVVSQGTAFKTITGDFAVNNGIANTDNFLLQLDQARVAMVGSIDAPKENQDLRITVFPSIDATSGALAVFAINPIAGLGALIGQYLVTNRINKAMQSDYLVQGSWTDPEIIPLNQQGQPLDPKVLDGIRAKGLLKEQTKPSAPTPNAPSPTTGQSSIESFSGSGVIATPN